jgi:hypothetical protein
LEPHKTPAVWFWGTEQADATVEISETFDAKMLAVRAHKSKENGWNDQEIEDFVKERARDAVGESGLESGLEFAESFRKITLGLRLHVQPGTLKRRTPRLPEHRRPQQRQRWASMRQQAVVELF